MNKTGPMLAVMALILAACGGSGNGETATTTAAPQTTTTTEAPGFVPSGDADMDAVATAYIVAFDSTTDYGTKLPYVEDLTGLEETVAKYIEQGETMGGVTIAITSVTINDDTADIQYDLLFNNNPVYPDLSGTALLIDGGWVVPRTEFCGMMSSARVPCPAE